METKFFVRIGDQIVNADNVVSFDEMVRTSSASGTLAPRRRWCSGPQFRMRLCLRSCSPNSGCSEGARCLLADEAIPSGDGSGIRKQNYE